MNSPFLCALGVCLIIALLSFVSYRGGCEGAVKSALSVLLLLSIALPLVGQLPQIFEQIAAPVYEFDGVNTVSSVSAEAFREGVRREICARFSLDVCDVTVSLEDFDPAVMRAGKIRVLLSGSAAFADARAIAAAIREAGLGECEVDLAFG